MKHPLAGLTQLEITQKGISMNLLQKSLLSIAATLALANTALASEEVSVEAQQKGLQIATEAERRDTGWGDSEASLKMLLSNKHGASSSREMRLKSLEVENDGDKSLTIFDQPRDVKGTAFLSFTHSLTPDEQWLYLPALKRVKRISSSNKSGPFMGSEYAFEDLTSFEVDKYDYQYLRDEVHAGQDSFVVRNFPRYAKSGYKHRDVWIDKAEYRVLKVDFYDRKGDLLKTLENKDYREFLDQYWRPMTASMVNHQTGKSTELVYSDYQFRVGLGERDFNKNSLKRAK